MEIDVIYGTAQTIYFPMIKAGSQDFAVAADWTPAAADAKRSIDGGTLTQCTNTIAIGVTGAAFWSLAVTAAETSGTRIVIQVVDSATKAVEDQCIILNTIKSGQLLGSRSMLQMEVNTGNVASSTTTLQATALYPASHTETTADHFIGRKIFFHDPSDALYGQGTSITDYSWDATYSEFVFTFDALTEAPSDGDLFIVV